MDDLALVPTPGEFRDAAQRRDVRQGEVDIDTVSDELDAQPGMPNGSLHTPCGPGGPTGALTPLTG
jgi:hypothetical protein